MKHQAHALLKQIEIFETISKSKKNYVEIVKDLVSNPNKISALEIKIKGNKHLLFNDQKPIKDFENFIIKKFQE